MPPHTAADLPPDIPEGFRPAPIGGPFLAHNGPLYARWAGDRLQVGFRVRPHHVNPLGICHGGMMATFADMLLPCVAIYAATGERRFLPTISLQMDYLGPSPLGAWVQGEGEVLRTTSNLLFAQGRVEADGAPVLRVSGIFKRGAVIAGDSDPFQLLKT